jgi:hypothetical protein
VLDLLLKFCSELRPTGAETRRLDLRRRERGKYKYMLVSDVRDLAFA